MVEHAESKVSAKGAGPLGSHDMQNLIHKGRKGGRVKGPETKEKSKQEERSTGPKKRIINIQKTSLKVSIKMKNQTTTQIERRQCSPATPC